MANVLSRGDARFVTHKLLPYFDIKRVRVAYSESKSKWPDIWVELNKVPVITVTDEFLRQPAQERRKRLCHEACHILGMSHGRVGKLVYSTHPEEDTYSAAVLRRIMNGHQ